LGIGLRYKTKNFVREEVKGKKGNRNQNSKHVMRTKMGMKKEEKNG
jgi:hypothetical protein